MSEIGDRIRSQAAIADRPGQMAELERIADEVDALVAAVGWVCLTCGSTCGDPIKHIWQEGDEASA